MCDFCLTNDENDKAFDLKSHVKSLESDICTIKDFLVNPNNQPNSHVPRSVNNTSVQGSPSPATNNPWDNPDQVSKLRQQTRIVIRYLNLICQLL